MASFEYWFVEASQIFRDNGNECLIDEEELQRYYDDGYTPLFAVREITSYAVNGF